MRLTWFLTEQTRDPAPHMAEQFRRFGVPQIAAEFFDLFLQIGHGFGRGLASQLPVGFKALFGHQQVVPGGFVVFLADHPLGERQCILDVHQRNVLFVRMEVNADGLRQRQFRQGFLRLGHQFVGSLELAFDVAEVHENRLANQVRVGQPQPFVCSFAVISSAKMGIRSSRTRCTLR